MPAGEAKSVELDELDFDEDLALLHGKPYTGVVVSFYDNGQRELEDHYTSGLPEGLRKEWHPNGKLKSEAEAIRGRGVAWLREWHENGKLAEEAEYRDLLPVVIRQWNVEGHLVLEWLREWSESGELIGETKQEFD